MDLLKRIRKFFGTIFRDSELKLTVVITKDLYDMNFIIFTIFYSDDRPDVFSKSSNPNKPWMRNKFGKLISGRARLRIYSRDFG